LLAVLVLPTAITGPRKAVNVTAVSPAGEGPAAGGPVREVREIPAVTLQEETPQGTPAESAELPPASLVEDGIRLKGLEPNLAIFRKTDSGSEPMHPGEKARAGERLRIGYQAAGFPYGAILSVDGNGNVTRHWPASGETSGRLENGEALLPSSFELDAAPDYERFYFVVSKRSFALDPLLQSLRENESLPDPKKIKSIRESETRIVRFDVLKESGI
jgi:hypothetical protein